MAYSPQEISNYPAQGYSWAQRNHISGVPRADGGQWAGPAPKPAPSSPISDLPHEGGVMTEAPSAVAHEPTGHPRWRSLSRRAVGFRIAHVVWGLVEIGALTYVWRCALFRRRDRYLWASITLLLVQGAALVVGRGNCPLGPHQRQLGDPVPMFELVLRPRAAKAAIPVPFAVAVAGMAAVLVRPPSGPSSPS